MEDNFDDKWILEKVNKIFPEKQTSFRIMLERIAFRNILYYLGEQWIAWYKSRGMFGSYNPLNLDIPTPVSNIIRDYIREMKSLILNKNYNTRVWPNSLETSDQDAANVGEALLQHEDSCDNGRIEDVKEDIALWTVLVGNAFARVHVDKDNGKYVVGDEGIARPAQDEISINCLTLFDVETPIRGRYMENKSWIATKELKSREWVEDTFEAILPKNSTNPKLVDYQKQLMTLIANVSPWKGADIDTSDADAEMEEEDLVLLKTVEWRPTLSYPQGRQAYVCDDTVVKSEKKLILPGRKETGDWNYALTHFSYNATPGGFWASGGVDDLISPQNTINRVDQAMEGNRESLGRPFVSMPKGSNLRRVSDKNVVFLALEYDPMTAGAVPKVYPGTPYPSQIIEERNIHKAVAQDAAGDPKNILRGQSPHSGASGIMVDILRETAEMSHAPDIKRFYRTWNKVNRKRIILAQSAYSNTRYLKIKGKGNEIEIKKFKGSDLHGNLDVRLELDSGLSSTHAGRNQMIMDMVQYGFFTGDLAARPDLQKELLRRLGLSGFPDQLNIHAERAEYENSVLTSNDEELLDTIAAPMIMDLDRDIVIDPLFEYDNHTIHLQVIDKLMLSAEYRGLAPERQLLVLGHRDLHKAAMEAEMEKEMAKAAEMGMLEEGQGPPTQGDGGRAEPLPDNAPPPSSEGGLM